MGSNRLERTAKLVVSNSLYGVTSNPGPFRESGKGLGLRRPVKVSAETEKKLMLNTGAGILPAQKGIKDGMPTSAQK